MLFQRCIYVYVLIKLLTYLIAFSTQRNRPNWQSQITPLTAENIVLGVWEVANADSAWKAHYKIHDPTRQWLITSVQAYSTC